MKPECLGYFMKVARNCEECSSLKECYRIFRDREKELEKLEDRRTCLWYKQSVLPGICDTCG